MKKNRWFLRMVALLSLSGLLMMTVSVAAEAGTDRDPLVTLSYLNETFLNSVMRRVDEKIAAQGGGTQGGDTFTVVSMASGQTLTGGIGCEVMLRVGSAVCVSPSAPGLIDETTAGTLNGGGGLEKNHLYMMTIEGRGVKATSADTKLLVRGSYTIG